MYVSASVGAVAEYVVVELPPLITVVPYWNQTELAVTESVSLSPVTVAAGVTFAGAAV